MKIFYDGIFHIKKKKKIYKEDIKNSLNFPLLLLHDFQVCLNCLKKNKE